MVKTVSVFEVVLLEDAGLSSKHQPPGRVSPYVFLLSATAQARDTRPCRLLGSADTRTGSAGCLVLGFPRHPWPGRSWGWGRPMPREVWMSGLTHPMAGRGCWPSAWRLAGTAGGAWFRLLSAWRPGAEACAPEESIARTQVEAGGLLTRQRESQNIRPTGVDGST